MKEHYRKHIKIDREKAGGCAPEEIIARALVQKFGEMDRPVLVAVGGPGGVGKSSFAARLAENVPGAAILPLDDYKTSRAERARKNIFGPHPEANQIDLIKQHLDDLRSGKTIDKPVYCRQRGESHRTERFAPQAFVVVEGEISTYKEFHALIDFSVFIDAHWKTQLNTRIQRDIEERGYSPKKAIAAFLYSNLHEFAEFGEESRNWADVHIHCDADYVMIIDAVCSQSLAFMVDEVSQDLAGVLTSGEMSHEGLNGKRSSVSGAR